MFKKNPADGVYVKFNATGVRLVAACPTEEYVAIFSGRSKMHMVKLDGSSPIQLDMVHHGEVHFAEWSVNGRWLFVASKSDPNIEVFQFTPNEMKK